MSNILEFIIFYQLEGNQENQVRKHDTNSVKIAHVWKNTFKFQYLNTKQIFMVIKLFVISNKSSQKNC